MILLAFVSSGILAIWPNRERRRACTIADRRGCPVVSMIVGVIDWMTLTFDLAFRWA